NETQPYAIIRSMYACELEHSRLIKYALARRPEYILRDGESASFDRELIHMAQLGTHDPRRIAGQQTNRQARQHFWTDNVELLRREQGLIERALRVACRGNEKIRRQALRDCQRCVELCENGVGSLPRERQLRSSVCQGPRPKRVKAPGNSGAEGDVGVGFPKLPVAVHGGPDRPHLVKAERNRRCEHKRVDALIGGIKSPAERQLKVTTFHSVIGKHKGILSKDALRLRR